MESKNIHMKSKGIPTMRVTGLMAEAFKKVLAPPKEGEAQKEIDPAIKNKISNGLNKYEGKGTYGDKANKQIIRLSSRKNFKSKNHTNRPSK